MTFHGFIENGRLILDDGTRLPEGARVDVRLRKTPARKSHTRRDPLADLGRFAISTGIVDMADQHDHYAYGTPKRTPSKSRTARITATKPRKGGRRA